MDLSDCINISSGKECEVCLGYSVVQICFVCLSTMSWNVFFCFFCFFFSYFSTVNIFLDITFIFIVLKLQNSPTSKTVHPLVHPTRCHMTRPTNGHKREALSRALLWHGNGGQLCSRQHGSGATVGLDHALLPGGTSLGF